MDEKYSEEEILLKIDPSLVIPPKYDPKLSSYECLVKIQDYKARLNEEKYNRILKLINYWIVKLNNNNINKKITNYKKDDKTPLKTLLSFRNFSYNDIMSNPEINIKVIKKKYIEYSDYFELSIYRKEYDKNDEHKKWESMDKDKVIKPEHFLKLIKELLNTIDYKLKYKSYNGVKFYSIHSNF